MSVLYIILCALIILSCVVINVLILMQKKRSAGMSGSMTGMGGQQTYWDKNKGRSLEGALEKYTKIFGAVFIIVSLAINFIV